MKIRKEVFEEVGRFDEKKLAVASMMCDLNPDEISAMNNRWRAILLSDPYYNPNLSLDSEDFKIKIN